MPEPPTEPWVCGVCGKGHGGHTFVEAVSHLYGMPEGEARAMVRRVMDRLSD